jgi:hypothetical protein
MKRLLAVVAVATILIGGVLSTSAAAKPSETAQNVQVRGVSEFVIETEGCTGLLMEPQDDGWGLDGCLSVLTITDSRLSEGGVYKEYGTERFEGSIVYSEGGVPDESTRVSGTFDTDYLITSKWAGEPFVSEQFHGRCQHPIKPGTGTDAFEGATGRLDFKDTIVDGIAVEFPYRGHIKLAA